MLPTIPDDRSYLAPRQVEDMERQQASLLRQIENPTIEDKGALRTRILDIKRSLAEDSPPVLTGDSLDEAVKEKRRLAAKISKGMLSHEEMMRSPRGAVDIEVAFQQKNVRDIVRWKNLDRITDPGNPSCADVDSLRPSRASLPMTEAMIPRKREFFDMSGLGARYDDIFPSPEGETLHERLARIDAAKRETEAEILAQGEKLPPQTAPGPKGPKTQAA